MLRDAFPGSSNELMSAIRLLPGVLATISAYLTLPLWSWLCFFPARFLVFMLICTGHGYPGQCDEPL